MFNIIKSIVAITYNLQQDEIVNIKNQCIVEFSVILNFLTSRAIYVSHFEGSHLRPSCLEQSNLSTVAVPYKGWLEYFIPMDFQWENFGLFSVFLPRQSFWTLKPLTYFLFL